MELILQRHGMRDDLKAVVQTAIVFAVGKGVLPVGNVQQGRGIDRHDRYTVEQFSTHNLWEANFR